MKSLPNHNPWLRGFYILTVIVMFIFMGLLIRVYWPDSFIKQTQGSMESQPDTIAGMQSELAKEEFQLYEHTAIDIAGIEKELFLAQDIALQMNSIWSELSHMNWNQWLKTESNFYPFYIYYQKYNEDRQSVGLIIGMEVNRFKYVPLHLNQKTIPTGKFLLRRSVIDTWLSPGSLPLSYANDFEVIDIDVNYNITSQTAYLSLSHSENADG